MGEIKVKPGICRICTAHCPIVVTTDDGRPIEVKGDPTGTPYEGYICPKGRALPEQHNDPRRVLHPQRRRPDGSFERIPSLQAVDEIADRLQAIIAEHGPESVALYLGAGSVVQVMGVPMGGALLHAIRSPMMFSASTIDKPAERIALALHGNWHAGLQSFATADAWLIVGANPVIAKSSGAPHNNPGMRLKQAGKRGMQLIVIDPRRTETTRRAAVHLQARPGEDPTVLAGLIRIIIAEGLYDREFVEANAVGLAELTAAVAPFTPDYVAERAGVPAEQLHAAARAFATARRGGAIASTGPSFSLRSNATFYLVLCLNTLCGFWAREGEPAPQPNVLLPAFTPRAQPQGPVPVFGKREMRVRGLRQTATGLPSAALPDEMLLPGPGQIKAFFCMGGNPVSAWPDQRKAEAALQSLELYVQFDSVMTASARHAHYVIGSRMALEVPSTTFAAEGLKFLNPGRGFDMPWGQYVEPAAEPPPGSDLIDEHELFFRVAQRLGLQLSWVNVHGSIFEESPKQVFKFDMDRIPTLEDLWEMTLCNSRVPLAELKANPHGLVVDEPVIVQPREEGCTDMLQLGDPLMMADLAEIAAEDFRAERTDPEYPFRLVSRRANSTMNSILVGLPAAARNKHHNPLFVHPEDLAGLGLRDGDVVRVSSRAGEVGAVVEGDDTLLRGVVAMTQGFGTSEEGAEDGTGRNPYLGANVNVLIPNDRDFDPITGIPRMSNIPVAIARYKAEAEVPVPA